MKKVRVNTNPHILQIHLKQNGFFPNSKLPVLLYEAVFNIPKQKNRAADIVQQVLLHNKWGNTWCNGIYDFHHYHSNTHECLAICMGEANVILGGPGGRKLMLKQGDVVILPAGTGHKCLSSSDNFVCVGAYPQDHNYDMNNGTEDEMEKALERITNVPVPTSDPLFGKEGFLKMYWG